MITRISRALTAFVAAIAIVSICSGAPGANAQEKLLKFNYGYPTADYITLYVAKDLGLFQKAGLDPTFYSFQSGAPLLAGLKSNSLDVVTTGLATVFALGQHIPLKFLFWEVDDSRSEAVVAAPNSGITSYKDIAKAKAIGAPSGTCAQVSLSLIAKKIGVPYEKLSVVNIAPPLYANAFKSGALQAAVAWAPYTYSLDEMGYKVVNWDADYVPYDGVCPVLTAVRPDFLQQHPEIGMKLVQVDAMAREAMAKNPQLGIDALAKYLSIPQVTAKANYERAAGKWLPSYEQQLDPKSPYSMTAQQGGLAKKLFVAAQAMYEAKSIPAPLTWEQIDDAIDPAYLKEYVNSHKGK